MRVRGCLGVRHVIHVLYADIRSIHNNYVKSWFIGPSQGGAFSSVDEPLVDGSIQDTTCIHIQNNACYKLYTVVEVVFRITQENKMAYKTLHGKSGIEGSFSISIILY